MADHNDRGRQGEEIALKHLRQQGYQIEALNWQSGRRELDIVASTSRELVVVEVKTRFYWPPKRPWTRASGD
ncbi:hypothetical protein Pgin04_00503 [Porphyromonas gingivalis]